MLAFTLSMPNVGSWDGKWSSSKKLFCIIKRLEKNKEAELDGRKFYYNFGDGWGASISVKKIDSKQAGVLRRKSSGFCGYNWMINSIIEKGYIES